MDEGRHTLEGANRTVENPIWGPDWAAVRAQWTLDPEAAFLNHGSFGATPRPVLDAQAKFRAEMERQPVDFLARRFPQLLEEAMAPLAAFLGAKPGNLAFVPNATTGVNAVVKSLRFEPDDELLIADHGYPAVIKTLERVAFTSGARVVQVRVPFPSRDGAGAEIVEAFLEAMTPRTRFAVVDQVTSPTALIFPIKVIVEACRERGVPVLVDGAHAPGMLPLNLESLGADFWTGNLHKWVCAPKGAGVLYVRPEWHSRIVPAVTSHYFGGGFPIEFGWTGTADPTAYFAVPAALAFLDSLGWARLRAHNHQLARYGRAVVAKALGVESPVPDSTEFYGSMSIVPLPESIPVPTPDDGVAINKRLWEERRIEVPVVSFRGRGFVRLSAQAYNAPAEYERLADTLAAMAGS